MNPPRRKMGNVSALDYAGCLLGDQHRMVCCSSGVFEAGGDVFCFQEGVVGEDFLFGGFGGEQFQHVLHADAHAANAWTPSTLIGVGGDAVSQVHHRRLSKILDRVKIGNVEVNREAESSCLKRGVQRAVARGAPESVYGLTWNRITVFMGHEDDH